MPVWIIDKVDIGPDGRHYRMFFETDHANLYSLAFDLRGGPVPGSHIFAKHVNGEMVIQGRRDVLVTQHMVYHAAVPDKPFVEFEDVVDPALAAAEEEAT